MNTLLPSAHVNLPFEAGSKGSVAETQIRALRAKQYTFYLDLHFREDDPQDRSRVSRLAGSGTRQADGRLVDNGVAIPVRLSVGRTDEAGHWSVLDRTFSDLELEGFDADSYSKIIVSLELKPGLYRARLEALDNVPSLREVPVRFDVHVSGRK